VVEMMDEEWEEEWIEEELGEEEDMWWEAYCDEHPDDPDCVP
jgi:hypothetical protein